MVGATIIPSGRECTNCHERYRQSQLGLCRLCEREIGVAVRRQFDVEEERVNRHRAKLLTLMAEEMQPLPYRVVTVKGVDYYVMWPREWARA